MRGAIACIYMCTCIEKHDRSNTIIGTVRATRYLVDVYHNLYNPVVSLNSITNWKMHANYICMVIT